MRSVPTPVKVGVIFLASIAALGIGAALAQTSTADEIAKYRAAFQRLADV